MEQKTVIILKKYTKSKKVAKSGKGKVKEEKKYIPDKPTFCTQCDKELDVFWMDRRAENPQLVMKNHERCIATGKFKGEFCSKLFIIGAYDIESAWFRDE
jgi:hypothetical protein